MRILLIYSGIILCCVASYANYGAGLCGIVFNRGSNVIIYDMNSNNENQIRGVFGEICDVLSNKILLYRRTESGECLNSYDLSTRNNNIIISNNSKLKTYILKEWDDPTNIRVTIDYGPRDSDEKMYRCNVFSKAMSNISYFDSMHDVVYKISNNINSNFSIVLSVDKGETARFGIYKNDKLLYRSEFESYSPRFMGDVVIFSHHGNIYSYDLLSGKLDCLTDFLEDDWSSDWYNGYNCFSISENHFLATEYVQPTENNFRPNVKVMHEIRIFSPQMGLKAVIPNARNPKWLDEQFDLKALNMKNSQFEQLHQKAYALYQQHKDTEAVKEYEEALKYGESGEFYYDYANSLSNLKDRLEDSLAAYWRSIELGFNKKYLAYYNIACIDSRMEKLQEAYENLEKALESGYKNLDHIETDSDLLNLRSDKGWKAKWADIRKGR
jgi:tetratricopeptide (TPR) repeat protein